MTYLKIQERQYQQSKTPNWKRVSLPETLFPAVENTVFSAVQLTQTGQSTLLNLKDVLAGKQDKQLILSMQQIEQYLNIDNNHMESFGAKFCGYNNSQFNHGILLHAKKGQTESIELDYQLTRDNALLIDHHLIVAEAAADVKVVMDYRSLDQTQHQHYGSIKVIAAPNARVNITVLQRLNDASFSFQQVFTSVAEAADVIVNDAQVGANIKVMSCVQQVDGFRANAATHSLYYGQPNSATDLAYTSKHGGKKSTSSIFSKGALQENSKKVFRGNLAFKRGATQAVGREEEFVLLLSKKLKSDSMPGLFCQEDDVIGEHAASVGQIDENKLFYMMSRGFNETEAKRLMIHSGYAEVIQKMNIGALGEIISSELDERINR